MLKDYIVENVIFITIYIYDVKLLWRQTRRNNGIRQGKQNLQ